MTTPYTPQNSPSSYNQSPPADDGTVSVSNQVLWATIKTKLADPLKVFIEDVNTALVSAFSKVINTDDLTFTTDVDFDNDQVVIFDDSANGYRVAPAAAFNGIAATEQATTSGTAVDFGSIPSWVTKITIVFNEVSLSGTDDLAVQIGDSGGLETTGYVASRTTLASDPAIAVVSSTTNFPIGFGSASRLFSGHMVLTAVDSDRLTWISSHGGKLSTTVTAFGGGSKTLSAGLDRVRITRSGTDTFDAGSVNIIYE